MNVTFTPTPLDSGKSSELLYALANERVDEAPRLVVGGQPIELPAQLAYIFKSIFEDFSQGKPITIIAHEAKMTTQQAADFLGVSRPTAIKLLEQYGIPVEQVNRHRRILFGDVQRLQQLIQQRQHGALREMRQLEKELGLLEAELTDEASK